MWELILSIGTIKKQKPRSAASEQGNSTTIPDAYRAARSRAPGLAHEFIAIFDVFCDQNLNLLACSEFCAFEGKRVSGALEGVKFFTNIVLSY